MGGVGKAISKATKSVFKAIGDVGTFVWNTGKGIVKDVVGIAEGIVTGDWVKIRDSALGVLNAAVAATAIVMGTFAEFFPGIGTIVGYTLIAAGVTMLDAQYNKGTLLRNTIATVGDAEELIFGTSNINNAAVEIQIALTFAATVYAGYYAGSALTEMWGVDAALATIPVEIKNVAQIAYYGYDIYQTVRGVLETREYYEAKLAEYQAAVEKWLAEGMALKEQWFSMWMDYDTRERIMPGGDLYNGGAGSYYYTPTAPHEGARYMLGMQATNDGEIDNTIMGRTNDYMPGGAGYINTIR